MSNINDILKKHAKRLGIEKQVEAVGVVEKAAKVIEKYIPREDFEVISFKDGVLKVGVKSSVVGNELSAMSGVIKKDLSQYKISKLIASKIESNNI